MVEAFHYTLNYEPVPWARPGGTSHRYDTQKNLKLLWGLELRKQHKGPLLTGPLHLDVLFAMPIPKKLSVSKRKLVHGTCHTKRPDRNNLTKLLEDTCNGVLFTDDSILCCSTEKKKYDENPRIEFTLTKVR